jgi:hypothetical protein
VLVDLDTARSVGHRVSPGWDRDTGETQIVVADSLTASLLGFLVQGEHVGDALGHPFRNAL